MTQFDPNKQYTWEPGDKFEISGAELGMIQNLTKSILYTEESQKVLLAQHVNTTMLTLISKGVEEGIVKEVPQVQK